MIVRDDVLIVACHRYVTAEPFLATVPLDKNHKYLILACDGVWDVATDQVKCGVL